MKLLACVALFSLAASAADRRFIVCLVAADTVQCTPPLTKEAGLAVYNVFLAAPIGNLDAVYLEDTKSKRKTQEHRPEQPVVHPQGEITL